MADLLTSLDAPPSGRATATWFDSLAYCQEKLLSGAPVPWGSPGELTALAGKAQGMFKSDALLVDLANLYAQRAAADGELRVAMAARSRPGYALRTLLADDRARAIALDAVTTISAGAGAIPVVLCIPSPARWLAVTADQASQDAAPPDRDRADTAAMYIADYLRTFAGEGVDGLLLDEGLAVAGDLIHPEAYRPVLNVAAHYEWPVLILSGTVPAWPHGPVTGVTGWIGSSAPSQAAGLSGILAGEDFWAGAEPASGTDLLLAVVPASADPGAVMQRVRALA
jgi:hypothetical protein